jgi:hypothetical protein
MSKNISQSVSVKWLRAIIAATVSIIAIGIALFLLSRADSSSPWIFFPSLILELPGIYLHTWLLGDPFAKLLPPADAAVITKQVIWFSLLFWFVFSFATTYFLKDRKYRIGAWCMVLVGCTIWAILFV